MQNAIQTKHNLDFLSCQSPYNVEGTDHKNFKIGTVEGMWGDTGDSYYILSAVNDEPGNGHLDDVFEWFEYSAKRDGKNLLVLECFNERFYDHLLAKRGFVMLDPNKENCIKIFNKKKYRKLLRDGNDIIQKGTLTCV